MSLYIGKPPAPPRRKSLRQVRDGLRVGGVLQKPRRSPISFVLIALAHAALLWLLALHMPKLPMFQEAAIQFNFVYRPVTTLRLIDEADQQAQGDAAAMALRPTAKLSVLSADFDKPLEQRITATLPALTPDLVVQDAVALPIEKPTPLQPALVPALVEAKVTTPTPAPVQAVAPAPAAVAVEGNAPRPRDEPAATPAPAAPPKQPTPVARVEEAAPKPAEPTPTAAPTPPPERAVVIEINLPPAQATPPPVKPPPPAVEPAPVAAAPPPVTAPSVAPRPTPVAMPAPAPAPSTTPAPTTAATPPAATQVQVIVNVPVAPGAGLPAGLPQSGLSAGSGSASVGGVGGTAAGVVGQAGTPARGGASASAAAAKPLDFRLPPLRGPYAAPLPTRQRSLSEMANEQLSRGTTSTKLEDGMSAAEKQECLSYKGGGLLNLPLSLLEILRNKCK